LSRKDKKGRSIGGPPFVQIFKYMLKSPAWRSLKPAARVLFIELASRYNGSNNGFLGLSGRDAAKACKCAQNTALDGFKALEDVGLVTCMTPGGFNRNDRRASEWRINTHRCDVTGKPATKAFMAWQPEGSKTERRLKPDAPQPQRKCSEAA
jgi:hypothetical protein